MKLLVIQAARLLSPARELELKFSAHHDNHRYSVANRGHQDVGKVGEVRIAFRERRALKEASSKLPYADAVHAPRPPRDTHKPARPSQPTPRAALVGLAETNTEKVVVVGAFND